MPLLDDLKVTIGERKDREKKGVSKDGRESRGDGKVEQTISGVLNKRRGSISSF